MKRVWGLFVLSLGVGMYSTSALAETGKAVNAMSSDVFSRFNVNTSRIYTIIHQ